MPKLSAASPRFGKMKFNTMSKLAFKKGLSEITANATQMLSLQRVFRGVGLFTYSSLKIKPQ